MKEIYDIHNLFCGPISTISNTPTGYRNFNSYRIFLYEKLIKNGQPKYVEVFTEENSYEIFDIIKKEDLENQQFGKNYLIDQINIRDYLTEDEKLVGKIGKKRLLEIYQQILFDCVKNSDIYIYHNKTFTK